MRNRHAHYLALLSDQAENQEKHVFDDDKLYNTLAEFLSDVHDLINLSTTSRSLYFRFLNTQYARLEKPFFDTKHRMLEENALSNAAYHPAMIIAAPTLELGIFLCTTSSVINQVFSSLKGKKMRPAELAVLVIALALVLGAALAIGSLSKKRMLRYFSGQITQSPSYHELQSITGDFNSREATLASMDALNIFIRIENAQKANVMKELFFQACLDGDITLVNKLLEKKALGFINTFIRLDNGIQITPLMAAAKNNHPEVVKALLEAGANPNLCEPGTIRNALIVACMALSLECVKPLLNVSPSILLPSNENDPDTTVFNMIAYYYQKTYFEPSNTPPSPKNFATCTAIYKQLLLAAIPKMRSDADFYLFLLTAIVLKEVPLIKEICKTASLKKLSGPNIQNALINILKSDETNAAALLLMDSYPTLKNMTLTKALFFRSVQRERYPRENQIKANPLFDFDYIDDEGFFALKLAAMRGDDARPRELITALVKGGANIERHTDNSKMTPLLYAVKGIHPEATATLIELGANIHHKDALGFSALDYAKAIIDGNMFMLAVHGVNIITTTPEQQHAVAASINEAAEKEREHALSFRH